MSSATVVRMILCAGSLTACTTTIEPYPVRSPETLGSREERDGLVVGAAALVDPKASERHFGADLSDAGILPVLIAAKNLSADTSYLLLEDRISLAPASASASVARTAATPLSETLATSTQVVGIVLVGASGAFPPLALVGLPVLVAGMAMGRDPAVVEHSLVTNALRSSTLSPGKDVQGFLYFARKDLPKGAPSAVMAVELTHLDTGAVERFELPISLESFP